jgi:hypothetical protein
LFFQIFVDIRPASASTVSTLLMQQKRFFGPYPLAPAPLYFALKAQVFRPSAEGLKAVEELYSSREHNTTIPFSLKISSCMV